MYYLSKDAEYYVQSRPREISQEMRKIHLLKQCRSSNKRSIKVLAFLRERFLPAKPNVGKTHSRTA